jgi:hypothetical protein
LPISGCKKIDGRVQRAVLWRQRRWIGIAASKAAARQYQNIGRRRKVMASAIIAIHLIIRNHTGCPRGENITRSSRRRGEGVIGAFSVNLVRAFQAVADVATVLGKKRGKLFGC